MYVFFSDNIPVVRRIKVINDKDLLVVTKNIQIS